MLTVQLTRAFREQLPEASLSIREGLSLIMQERLYLVGPRKDTTESNQPITLKAVADIPLVIPNRPHTVRMLLESHMAEIGCHPNIDLEIDGVSAILGLVADGVGHAVLSQNAVVTSPQPERYSVRPIVQPEIPSRLYLATVSRRISTLTQQAVQKLICACVRQVYPAGLIALD